MEFTSVQEKIIKTNMPNVVVLSSAASGKSTVIVERIRWLLSQGIPPEEIVAITFTNNAASVMFERLGNPEGLFIGTVHSYCNYLLRGGAIDTSNIIQQERFDDLFEEIKANPQCIKHISDLIVDEAQDSTEQQFEFFELLNPDCFMYVGDIKQSIYGFNGACPNYLINLAARPDVTTYSMRQNFRNASDILRFAKKFLYRLGPDYDDDSIPMRVPENRNYMHVLEGEYTMNDAVESLKFYKEKFNTKWGDWFVLCRTNKDIEDFTYLFTKQGIPNDTFKQADLTNSQIKEKIKEDTVKILTVHSAKGLEVSNVLSYNIRAYNDEEARLCYVSATRAKDFLLWVKTPPKRKKKTKTFSWE